MSNWTHGNKLSDLQEWYQKQALIEAYQFLQNFLNPVFYLPPSFLRGPVL